MKPALLLALAAVLLAGHASRAADIQPAVQRTVLEDDAVRVEELRVRGQVQQIRVAPKIGPLRRGYEIVPPDAGRDPSSSARGLAGQRVWQVLSF